MKNIILLILLGLRVMINLEDEFLLCTLAAFSVAMMKRNATDCHVFIRMVRQVCESVGLNCK